MQLKESDKVEIQTLQANIDLFAQHNLPEYTLQQCCGGHGPGSGCSH